MNFDVDYGVVYFDDTGCGFIISLSSLFVKIFFLYMNQSTSDAKFNRFSNYWGSYFYTSYKIFVLEFSRLFIETNFRMVDKLSDFFMSFTHTHTPSEWKFDFEIIKLLWSTVSIYWKIPHRKQKNCDCLKLEYTESNRIMIQHFKKKKKKKEPREDGSDSRHKKVKLTNGLLWSVEELKQIQFLLQIIAIYLYCCFCF